MRIKTEHLADALKELKPIISNFGMIQILSCVHIKTGDDMRLTASDGDQMLSLSIEFDGEARETCVNFNQLLWSLGEAEEASLIFDDRSLTVTCGNKISRLSTIDPVDFPASPDESKFRRILPDEIAKDISEGILAVHGFEASEIDARPNLEGTNIKGSSKLIECKASSGRILAIWSRPLISADFDITVPAKFCKPLGEALAMDGDKFSLSPNKASVAWPDGHYDCKLNETPFPSTKSITDFKMNHIGTLEIDPLLPELEACIALTSKDKTPTIELNFSDKGISTGFAGMSNNQFSGAFKPFTAIANAAYLRQCLSCFDGSCEIFGSAGMMLFGKGDLRVYLCLMGAK